MPRLERKAECHPDRTYRANGLCQSCYQAARRATPEGKTRRKAYNKARYARPEVKARQKAYYSTPEVKARRKTYHKTYQKTYNDKPEVKARAYARRIGIEFETALPWFEIPTADRACWLCGENGENIVLDHNHDTKVIRGWAHRGCNIIEGYWRQVSNPQRLFQTLERLQV